VALTVRLLPPARGFPRGRYMGKPYVAAGGNAAELPQGEREMPVHRKLIANPPPWPNGARCAVAFTFDMDADSILHLAHHTSADTRLAAMSMLRYGPEIAVPRLVELYQRFGMHQTFFLPAWCMERYPAAVHAILHGG